MAFDSDRAVIVLFGGALDGMGASSGDTWEWNGIAWTQRAVSGPEPRLLHAMVYDPVHAATVLFGGSAPSGPSRETWELVAICTADFNGDGSVNSQDLFDFLSAFFAVAPYADFNRDGVINSQDFFDFLAAFFAGC
jgi:hypothetical protein